MQICLVSSAYRPYISGVGEHVHHLGVELQKRGHNVHVITSSYQTIHETELLPSTRVGTGCILPFAGGEFTLPVGMKLGLEVKKIFQKQSFDIVHCHGIFPPDLAYWAAIYSHTPPIVTFHTVTPRLPNVIGNALGLLLRKLNSKLSARIAVSQAAKMWAERIFPGCYHVIPNGVDLRRFRPDVSPALPINSHPKIIYVGRLEKRKGLKYLLLSLPKVLREFPKTVLIIIGYGRSKNYFMRLARKVGVSDSIQYLGPLANSKLPGYYKSATVCVAPATNDEAMGIILIEAMACGVPVIASNILGYNEVIKDGVNGILVPKRNASKLAEALITILSDPNLRKKISENALLSAKQYDWTAIAAKVEAVYKEIL